MKKAVITGFECFGNYNMNPTERLMREIGGKIISSHRIQALVFPVGPLVGEKAVDYGRRIILSAGRVEASVIIALGIASQVKGVRIEGRCSNWVENDKYCDQFENRKTFIQYDLPKMERFTPFGRWNMPKMFEEFSKAKIPFEREISRDPGTFCCNALMYRMLRRMSETPFSIPFIMAHVPCTKDAVKNISNFNGVLITQKQLKKVVEILLKSYV